MSIRKHIPNTITSMNLLSGVLGVIFCLEGRLDLAFLLMLAAAVFDFLDGFAARLLGAYSDIGKELDSLSDVVSFGVLPSLMLFRLMSGSGHHVLCYVTLILAVFSALRLAKFNIDPRQHSSFIGLPTPASAMICGSFSYCAYFRSGAAFTQLAESSLFPPLLAIVLSALLVSEIPMFAMKFGKGTHSDTQTSIKRTAFITISVIMAVVVAVLSLSWAAVILFSMTAYILINLVYLLIPNNSRP